MRVCNPPLISLNLETRVYLLMYLCESPEQLTADRYSKGGNVIYLAWNLEGQGSSLSQKAAEDQVPPFLEEILVLKLRIILATWQPSELILPI